MGKVMAADEAIWLDRIEGDAALRDRLKAMNLGATIDLDVSGYVGRWERITATRDGLTVDGMSPTEPVRDSWSRLCAEGRIVEVRAVGPNETHLATFEERLYRWDIPESRIYS